MTETHPDELAFLRAIRAAPADDLPRLVYADWLDEHDESKRAELIRVQVAAEPASPCRSCSAWSQRDCPEPGCRFGMDCRASALVASIDHPEIPWHIGGGGPGETRVGVFYRRGFMECFRGTLEGAIGHLPTLVRHPLAVVTRVRLTDRESVFIEEGLHRDTNWSWVIRPSEDLLIPDDERPHFLPRGIWNQLNGYLTTPSARTRARRYHTRELAEVALSDALLRWAELPF